MKKTSVIYLSTYPPRECGIATFTRDLVSAISGRAGPEITSKIIAINEGLSSFYNYPAEVFGIIAANRIQDYLVMAEKINNDKDIKLVSVQHEYGIFGGEMSDHLLPFIHHLKKPIVTTLHSVLPNPDKHLLDLTRYICDKSQAIVVMNNLSRDLLVKDYNAAGSNIVVIPHGIPSVPFEPSSRAKASLGLEDNIILSTFGLLGPSKGVEYAIRALPPLVRRHPRLLYLIIGATHPNVRKEQGERYRNFLQKEVIRLNLQKNVKFYNKYLSLNEIIDYLKATDVYIATALGKEQSVSGTISYALGCGRPVISTATSYACYLINNDRGRLVKFKNSKEVSRALSEIIKNNQLMIDMSKNAYSATRQMTWPNVGTAYWSVFKRAAGITGEINYLPELNLNHLYRMTDELGVRHHSRYSQPQKRFGYSIDDNARALVVAVKCHLPDLVKKYLNFMNFSQKTDGSFAYLVGANRKHDWRYEEDVQGRAIWALGYFLAADVSDLKLQKLAQSMFNKSLRHTEKLTAPRAIAFTIKGLYFYLKKHSNKRIYDLFKKLADKQAFFYEQTAANDWHWFEDCLTYSNSKLPESLFYAYDLIKKSKYLEIADKSLKFLQKITFEKDYYAPIGQAGWYIRNKNRSYFDQQPEDAASMVETKVAAYRITGDRRHIQDAYTVFQWFMGSNSLGIMIYDEATGGCHDGVSRYALNLNQGAESTISYLLARLAIEEIWKDIFPKHTNKQ